MPDFWTLWIGAVVAAVIFACTRGFVQALFDDWRAWRSRHRDIIVNNIDLANDEAFMLELHAAVRNSYVRKGDNGS